MRSQPLSSKVPGASMLRLMTAVSAPRTCAGATPSGSAWRSALCASRWNAPQRYAIERPIAGKLPSGAISRSWIAAWRRARVSTRDARSFQAGDSSWQAAITSTSIG